MKAIVYTRVSTDEQGESGLGLTAQHDAACLEAGRRGWDVETISDVGVSAKTLKRPGLQRALDQLAAGDAQALVVAKVDRLSRSMADFTALLDRSHREGWAIVALDLGVDTTTPNGKFLAQIIGSVAELERNLIGERTRQALAVKKAQGIRLGRPILLPDDVRERILLGRATGQTYRAIAAELNTEGVPTAQGGRCWYPATVRSIERRAA